MSIGIDRETDSERGQSRVEKCEIGLVVIYPHGGGISLDGEGVDLVEGLEKVEVRLEEFWRKCVIGADVDLSRVSEQAAFTHLREESEVPGEIPVVSFPMTGILFLGENTLDVACRKV